MYAAATHAAKAGRTRVDVSPPRNILSEGDVPSKIPRRNKNRIEKSRKEKKNQEKKRKIKKRKENQRKVAYCPYSVKKWAKIYDYRGCNPLPRFLPSKCPSFRRHCAAMSLHCSNVTLTV